MKIALIGNMNNNHFSIMRYLRDRGYDAHLFLFANDGIGDHSHFAPEADTFEYEKWEPFIHQTPFVSSGFRILKNLPKIGVARKLFKDYDYFIGNNFATMVTLLAGKRLNIFMPHSIGGDYLGRTELRGIGLKEKLKKIMYHNIQYYCLKYNTNYIGTIDKTEGNLVYFRKYSLIDKIKPLAMPMVYASKKVNVTGDTITHNIVSGLNGKFPIIISHMSHHKDPWIKKLKGNDIVLKGYAKYLKSTSNHNAVLILLEYGSDIASSKKLIKELGIESQVLWIPKMLRKNILNLLEYVDIGANAMGGYLWGGTGWEFIAKGVPFIHNIGRTTYEFKEETGMECPDIFHAKDENDIAEVLSKITKNPGLLKEKSENLKKWFENYNNKMIDNIIYYLKN